MEKISIKSIFSNDPEILRAIEARENRVVLRELLLREAKQEPEEVQFKFLKGERGPLPSEEDLIPIILKLIPPPIKGKDGRDGRDGKNGIDGKDGINATPFKETTVTQKELEPLLITQDVVREIVKIMHSLPESDKLEVSKGIRNAQSFIYGGTKYKTSELMHGGGANSSSSSGYQQPTSGAVNGINQVFVWTTAPTVIVVDQGRPMQKVSSDGTINWTGTTTTTLAVAPNFDIFSTN